MRLLELHFRHKFFQRRRRAGSANEIFPAQQAWNGINLDDVPELIQSMRFVGLSNGACGENRCRNRGNGTSSGRQDYRVIDRILDMQDNEAHSFHLLSEKRKGAARKSGPLGVSNG